MQNANLKQVPRPGIKKKKKKDLTKLYTPPPKIYFRDPIGFELPSSLHKFRWNGDKVERKLQEKIQEKTQIVGNFVYQQAYRLLEGPRGKGIDFDSFREQLRIKFGILLDDSELRLLFDKFDEDKNGKIDMQEFIRRVLPPDYNFGGQWYEISQLVGEEKAAHLRDEARQEFLVCQGDAKIVHIKNMGAVSNWTLKQLVQQIQAKVLQKTPSSEDQYRRAFKMLRSGRDQGIRIKGLQYNLRTKFGIYATDDQMRQLFSMYDLDSNGEIDLKEFLQLIDPPAFPSNSNVPGGIWTQSDSDSEDEDTVGDKNEGIDAQTLLAPPATSLSQRSASSDCIDGQNTDTDKPMRAERERPRTADPLMLQKRREKLEYQQLMCDNIKQTCLMPINPVKVVPSRAGECEENGKVPLSRLWSRSVVDLKEAGMDNISNRSERSHTRPLSAGSVRSYCSSSCSSIKRATFMKRSSTPQTLRQKCLESRKVLKGAGGEAYLKSQKKQAPKKAAQDSAERWGHQRRHLFLESPSVLGNRIQCGSSCNTKKLHDADEYVPRVVRVHAMQHNEKPYSPSRMLRRSCGKQNNMK
ncbi:EF-hand domain pair [Plasmopara halstedii]|uniref:EF-hand domain pair n=1 Tax=Plasmopara halstedii TaxID=4781 RepID=A0A0P1B5D0_PLAHL|nr:EF-hand domain pair [Plasmopara halstedii]CEG50024.1 EF-hand domain pair [Plasmopara halstedii]|eukprot:XP_024586393.1 EF-hand domain pair [Plasmopara halstedii]